jgi:hypothetical protein
MRTSSKTSSVIPFPAPRPFARRPIASSAPGMTCMVLVRHHQTDKAILVSDTGIYSAAVWIPKSMVTIEMPSSRGILVASMSKAFAQQKNLHERAIDPTLFNEATREVLADANARAARKRNFYRRYAAPTANCMNRNAFA